MKNGFLHDTTILSAEENIDFVRQIVSKDPEMFIRILLEQFGVVYSKIHLWKQIKIGIEFVSVNQRVRSFITEAWIWLWFILNIEHSRRYSITKTKWKNINTYRGVNLFVIHLKY